MTEPNIIDDSKLIAVDESIGLPSPDTFKPSTADKVVNHLFDPRKKFMISRLSPGESVIVVRLKIIAYKFHSDLLNSFTDWLIERSIGREGKSREEIPQVLAALVSKGKNKNRQFGNRPPRGDRYENNNSYAEDE